MDRVETCRISGHEIAYWCAGSGAPVRLAEIFLEGMDGRASAA